MSTDKTAAADDYPFPGTADQDAPTLRSEPDADWIAMRGVMQELCAEIRPLFELSEPPPWAVSLQFVLDVALPKVEAICQSE